jgi:dolichyl-phosphate-mannose-protein mannosyltransferase
VTRTFRRSFDEVHFGGFARKYIRQTFFMDVHPPLAKLLIALAAKIGGFKGDFDFKDIGKSVLYHSSRVSESDTH